ncbi:hypothetical protein POM88_050364 [Heracleum sosnowskyi]|uniref:Uncharacterized protein n=1 Tax=Heracleum sosnowskyi TaxID=360622 RepID=A0AAD8M2K9_9APIA|nr:hypothetical protein POM88_050364 [Heracleum sosnowskyi]
MIWGINDISVDEIKDKVDALGSSGFMTSYLRIPSFLMDVVLSSLISQGDCNMMVGYGKENNYRVDVYVDQHSEHELTNKDYENVHLEEYSCAEVMSFLIWCRVGGEDKTTSWVGK